MRQLTASEASNDEIDFEEFESFERVMESSPRAGMLDFTLKEDGTEYRSAATRIVFGSWRVATHQAALKSKQGEV